MQSRLVTQQGASGLETCLYNYSNKLHACMRPCDLQSQHCRYLWTNKGKERCSAWSKRALWEPQQVETPSMNLQEKHVEVI